MSTILRLLFANGASTVAAVRVAEAGAVTDYQDAFAALGKAGGPDSGVRQRRAETVQQALRTAVEDASAAAAGADRRGGRRAVRRRRSWWTHAAALNSERMVLVGPDALDSGGKTLPGVFAAAALAGVDRLRTGPGGAPQRGGDLGAGGPEHRTTPTTTSTCWCGAA